MEHDLHEPTMIDALTDLSGRLHTMYKKREVDWDLVLELGQSLSIYVEWRATVLARTAKYEQN